MGELLGESERVVYTSDMDQAKSLQQEALGIIKELNLLDILAPFGEARLVGSVALDLVVKPDIDIHLLLDGKEVVSTTNKIAGLLIAKEIVKEIRISDYLENNSLKIGIDHFSGKTTEWSIDIWITSDPSTTGFELTDKIKQELPPKQREVILLIKRSYYEKGLLRDGLSPKIYSAVLDHGVSSLEEFFDHVSGLP